MSQIVPFPQPVRVEMDAAIKKAVSAIPLDAKGLVTGAVTKQGVEIAAGYKVRSNINVGGYAAKLWGGGWEYGAKAAVVLGRK